MAVKRFKDEEIERANSISIFDYAISKGLELKRVGVNSYKIDNYGGLHINSLENKWNSFSERKGGGPIQLIMFMEDKTWVESVKQLLGITSSNTSYKSIINAEEVNDKGDLVLPEKNNTYKHMIAYLIQTRKIDKDIVYRLINEEKLYEDKKRNCVFIGYDKNNNAKYASLRGTNINRPFRGDTKNSDKAYPFHIDGTSNKVYVCEAPIEVMSYLTLQKMFNNNCTFNHSIISLGGVGDIALGQYLKDNPNIAEINLCLNNDDAGIKATNQIGEKYMKDYKIKVEYPISKDYNQDLQNFVKTMQIENKIMFQEDEEEEFELEI